MFTLSINSSKKSIRIGSFSKKNLEHEAYKSSILVLDDDFDLASLVKQILQKHGFKNVFAFTNPLLALEHFRINYRGY
jgi:PleD family two-component response regulator